MYRVLRRLFKGGGFLEAGKLTSLQWLDEDNVRRLEEAGAVSRLQAPPLEQIPGFSRRASRLEELEINTVEEFLTSDEKVVAAHFRVKLTTVERWKREVREWLAPPVKNRK